MITKDALTLLKKTPPFSFLDEAVLRNIAQKILMEFYPKGKTIVRQGGPAPEYLNLIINGSVRIFVRTNEGEEVLVGFRTAGDFFGMVSFVYGDLSLDTVVAAEDTSCYLIQQETVLGLLKTHAEFAEFCLRVVVRRLVEMTYKDIHDRTLLYGGGDKLLFTSILGDLAVKKVITGPEDMTIREAAAIMAEHQISSLVLLDAGGLPSGLITDRDLRNKVVARGRDMSEKASDIMSVTMIKSEASDYCFEALLKMIRYNIHHLLVLNKGELTGIITNHDLMMFQGLSPLSIAREIENQTTIDGLAPAAKKINKIVSVLIKEGAKSGNITRIITEINDRLLRKLLEIAERRMGPPPVSYCWIVYGSEGRKEQTFKTDQDNGIIYEDSQGSRQDVEQYFSDFAASMKEGLTRCGFPPCKADCMASNRTWRQPLHVWKDYFSKWINTPTPESILHSVIFFDFRPVHGNLLLAEKLRAFLGHETRDKNVFLAHMAGHVVKNRPPLGLFGNFECEKKGSRKGTFDIKINALSPVIDAARLSALEAGVYHTSTLARLMELKERKGAVISGHCRELEQVFEYLMSLRLRHQFQQLEEGREADNFINPERLGVLDKRMLKESLKLISAVQNVVMKKYGGYMVL